MCYDHSSPKIKNQGHRLGSMSAKKMVTVWSGVGGAVDRALHLRLKILLLSQSSVNLH